MRYPRFYRFFWFSLLLSTAPLRAQQLAQRLEPHIQDHQGMVSVAVKHLDTGESFAHRADEPMPTASLIKMAVMVEAYRQADQEELDLDTLVTLKEDDKVPGSGILTLHFSEGTQLRLRDAIRLMIAYSDNTATNLVLDQIGIRSVGETMERLGYPHTRLHAKVFRRETSIDPDRSKQFGLGSTTANETVALLEQLHHKRLVDAEASEEMLSHLHHCEDRLKIVRHLPGGTKFAHKTGSVSDVRCDAGILTTPAGPVAICVLTNQNQDHSWGDRNEAELLCAEIGREVYAHFNPQSKSQFSADQVLKVGASGELVEDLQRTLNERLEPSPELSVDGEFGPVTEAAVKLFQREQDLQAHGRVDTQTWSKLGPLVTRDVPVPDPAEVNAEQLDLRPAETLDGPPLVTCKAWAVADGVTGELLWGEDEGRALDMASTTKIMTAYLIVQLAAQDESILDEEVVFTERADKTIGSTSGIRAGEKLSVRELLYGLMLPSGNDASVALAEHFGARLAEDASPADQDALQQFVTAMNRAAQELGMKKTQYKNPHGLTTDEHQSSAHDLVRLAYAALAKPLFCHYVGTRQRGCTVTGPGGYQRNVLWKNTNQLLRIEGYSGIKTGTTDAAGACLVSRGRHAEDDLLVVVLGSSSSEARYVDTRNLFRWAWKKRMKDEKKGKRH